MTDNCVSEKPFFACLTSNFALGLSAGLWAGHECFNESNLHVTTLHFQRVQNKIARMSYGATGEFSSLRQPVFRDSQIKKPF